MATFTQDMQGLHKARQTIESNVPPAVLRQLEKIAQQGIHPHSLFQHYTAVFEQGQAQRLSQVAPAPLPVLDDHPKSLDAKHPCFCPWCSSMFKQEKDFIRHVKEQHAETSFRCPDCSTTYTRRHRLAEHHKKIHPDRCGPGDCSHARGAAIRLNDPEILGCGLCPEVVRSSLHRYVRHLINCHYRHGATLAGWQSGPNIPSTSHARPFSPPPKIKLSGSLEHQGSASDFSALRSGFGLDDSSPDRTDSAISNGSTLFDPIDVALANQYAAKANWDPYYNPQNMAFMNSMPATAGTQNQPTIFDHPHQQNNNQADEFGDMMQYINDDHYFTNNTFIDPSDDPIVPQSQAVASTCAQLLYPGSMDIDDGNAVEAPHHPMSLPFNPTPPLDFTKDRRRSSMSGRLLRKMQSLSPLRTEFGIH